MKNSKYINTGVQKIRTVADKNLQNRLFQALHESILRSHIPISPRVLSAKYDLDIEDLLHFRIVLFRDQIIDFLHSLNLSMKSEEVKKLVRAGTYSKAFGKEISKHTDQKRFVFTYSEILILLNLDADIEILQPSEIRNLNLGASLEVGLDFPDDIPEKEIIKFVKDAVQLLDESHRLYGGKGLRVNDVRVLELVHELIPDK